MTVHMEIQIVSFIWAGERKWTQNAPIRVSVKFEKLSTGEICLIIHKIKQTRGTWNIHFMAIFVFKGRFSSYSIKLCMYMYSVLWTARVNILKCLLLCVFPIMEDNHLPSTKYTNIIDTSVKTSILAAGSNLNHNSFNLFCLRSEWKEMSLTTGLDFWKK